MKQKLILVFFSLFALNMVRAQHIADLSRLVMEAEKGDALAMTQLGKLYLQGERIKPDTAKAYAYFQNAARQGLPEAAYYQAKCLENGYGIVVDEERAVRLYETAFEWIVQQADSGNLECQLFLVRRYAEGIGTERDMLKAAVWMAKAAEAGSPEAQYALSHCYNSGEGVNKDDQLAARWCLTAAENGLAEAQYETAQRFFRGEGLNKSESKAVSWLTKAAAQNYGLAQYALAQCYEEGTGVKRQAEKAKLLYEQAAQNGVNEAVLKTAQTYATKGDEAAKAVEWLRQAAAQGDDAAMCELAKRYMKGDGGEKDVAKAAELYRKAAQKGNPEAQNAWGDCLLNGVGTEKDVEQAAT
ncbi:MAG: sel1 repeat family protein, partial [Bacteroidaceae bacterium]|nr:sel1 repeat family protein [Bacteroidaceae bacterium]